MLANSLPPSLISSLPPSSSPSRTTSTSGTLQPLTYYPIPSACTQREVALRILRSPFTIASTAPMADQSQHNQVTYPYILDGTGLSIDIDRSPQGQHNIDQSQSPVHGQNQVHMSPPDGVGAPPSTFMYHPFVHASQPPYPPSLQQESPTAHLGQVQTLTLDPAQLRTPSVGPSRVLTRRQARMASSHPYSNTSQQENQQQQQQVNEGFGIFGASSHSPQTPNTFHTGAQLADGRIGLPDLNIGQITLPNASAMSPQHPSTPASVTSSSTFSHYGFAQYASNGHSRSGSSSTHPRSTSPAASVVSAATSLSSASDPKSGRSRPPVSASSTGCVSVASFGIGPTDITTVKPKRRLQNRQRKEICQYFIEHPNSRQEDIAARWGVERSTVSKILKHKNRWMAVSDGDDQATAKHRPPKFADIEHRMESWLVEMRDSRTPITDAMIREKARAYARELEIPEDKFKASAGWVENYKHRANIKKGVWIGRPLPGTYPDDECDKEALQGPFLHELIAEKRREDALRAAEERAERAIEELDTDIDIPSVGLNSSPVTLDPAGEWTPLSLTFGDSCSTNTLGLETNQMNSMDNAVGPRSAMQNPSNGESATTFPTGGNPQQQHFTATGTSWLGQGAGVSNDAMPGPPSVTAQEASAAMDAVFRFLQTRQPDFLDQQVMNVLTDVRQIIWVYATQAASSANRAPTTTTNAATTNPGTVTNANAAKSGISSSDASSGGEAVVAQAA